MIYFSLAKLQKMLGLLFSLAKIQTFEKNSRFGFFEVSLVVDFISIKPKNTITHFIYLFFIFHFNNIIIKYRKKTMSKQI